jgi:hypothetical protein
VDGYQLLLASSVGERDGLGLELSTEGGYLLAEVFRDDVTGQFTFASFDETPLPLEALRWFLDVAEDRLRPAADTSTT